MANILSAAAKEGFASGDVDWPNDDIRVVLLTSAYTYSAAHNFLDDIGAGFRVATAALAGKTATSGALDADDTLFAALTGSAVTQMWVYFHTGTEATSRLLIYINEAEGLPFTPNGDNKRIVWPNGADKIALL